MIFHLRNHYALVYALRAWTATDGTRVRQLLTTRCGQGEGVALLRAPQLTAGGRRRGQRPSQWIDFAEARETMLRWGGYKIMAVDNMNQAT